MTFALNIRAMTFNKGEKINQYTISFPHKQSSYAETYRVKDVNGKTRFLKLIDYSKLNHNQIDEYGNILEIEITKQCNHHNLCKYIDSGRIFASGKQWAYLVTEFVSGETLSQKIIRDGELEIYSIKQVAFSVLNGLQYLHSLPRPVVHGEVTIQNILVNLDGGWKDLKLIDYGHARYLDQQPSKSNLNASNLFYLAPECFSGVLQIQSDIYSVGVLLYQLIYGELPWFIDLSRLNASERIDYILNERTKGLNIPMIEKFELDEQLVNCVVKALSYDAEDRFKSAEEFIRGLNGDLKVERQSSKKKILSDSFSDEAKQIKLSDKSGLGFAAIAGMEELKTQLMEEVIEPLHHPEDYKRYGVTIPNGMLLYGPPGCGKTFFAKHFAEEVGFNFMCITPATLKSRYVNATQENIAKMFKDAEEKAPTIIFIDEINELVPNRESDVHEMSKSAVNEMLAQMDRTGEKGIFIIGATNYPHTIDPAMLRAGRLDKKYYVGVPDKEARKALFELYLKNRPYDFGIDYNELADLTENYVSADIQLIVNNASRSALKQHSKITMEILKTTIKTTSPSITLEELERYEKIKENMENNSFNRKNRKRIGFK